MSPWFQIGRKHFESVPFEVACACGQLAKGYRRPDHQVIACPGCGRSIFILPLSPLPAPQAAEDRGSKVEDQERKTNSFLVLRGGLWRPLLTGVGVFALVALTSILILLPKYQDPASPYSPKSAAAHFTEGKKLLSQGRFRDARHEIMEAGIWDMKAPGSLSPADKKSLKQADREAYLFSQLLTEPLEDILFQAAAERDDREWQAVFSDRYKGKSFLILAESRRDASNRWVLDYDVFVRDRRARIDWENLKLLQDLHLDQPQRLMLGARLAKVEPEPGATWVVRLEPDSGVLLTDAEAVATILSRPVEGLEEVLKRQAAWVAAMP
jgi:hypothetical protein